MRHFDAPAAWSARLTVEWHPSTVPSSHHFAGHCRHTPQLAAPLNQGMGGEGQKSPPLSSQDPPPLRENGCALQNGNAISIPYHKGRSAALDIMSTEQSPECSEWGQGRSNEI